MVNRFTEKAQNALNRALSAARELGHNYVGTEHLLLGLSGEADSIAHRVLTGRGVRYERLFRRVRESATFSGKNAVSAADMTPFFRRKIMKATMLSPGIRVPSKSNRANSNRFSIRPSPGQYQVMQNSVTYQVFWWGS